MISGQTAGNLQSENPFWRETLRAHNVDVLWQ